MTIELALAIHDVSGEYSRHAGVALHSLLSQASQPVRAHILHDATLTDENRRRLRKIVEAAGAGIAFYPVQLPAEWAAVSTGAYTPGILFRLLTPQLLLSTNCYILTAILSVGWISRRYGASRCPGGQSQPFPTGA